MTGDVRENGTGTVRVYGPATPDNDVIIKVRSKKRNEKKHC